MPTIDCFRPTYGLAVSAILALGGCETLPSFADREKYRGTQGYDLDTFVPPPKRTELVFKGETDQGFPRGNYRLLSGIGGPIFTATSNGSDPIRQSVETGKLDGVIDLSVVDGGRTVFYDKFPHPLEAKLEFTWRPNQARFLLTPSDLPREEYYRDSDLQNPNSLPDPTEPLEPKIKIRLEDSSFGD